MAAERTRMHAAMTSDAAGPVVREYRVQVTPEAVGEYWKKLNPADYRPMQTHEAEW